MRFEYRRVQRASLRLASLLFIVASACGSANKPAAPGNTSGQVQVLLQNSTSATISITLSGPGFSGRNYNLASSAFVTDEVPGAAGDLISVLASGGGFTAGTGGCTATSAIITTSEYGQIVFAEPAASGAPIGILCQSGWQ